MKLKQPLEVQHQAATTRFTTPAGFVLAVLETANFPARDSFRRKYARAVQLPLIDRSAGQGEPSREHHVVVAKKSAAGQPRRRVEILRGLQADL